MLLRLRRRTRTPHVLLANRESGQALLELALITPILVLLLMAVFQFAYVFQSQMGLTNAVREAARRAAATTSDAPTWTGTGSLQAWVQAQLCGGTSPCDGGLLKENVQGFDGTKLWSDPPTVTFCTYPAAGKNQYQVDVAVKYKHPLFFGPMGFATDLVDGSPNGYWDLSASAQMRLEGVDSTAAGFNPPPGPAC
jgi:Flp pilus assembly protein TadG